MKITEISEIILYNFYYMKSSHYNYLKKKQKKNNYRYFKEILKF